MISALGLLDHVQEQIEAIYDLERPASVSDYLIDRRSLEAAGVSVQASEEVFVVESDQAVDVGLYLAPELFERLRGKNPRGPSGLSLVTDELAAFVTVAEGVSHVLYLLRCADGGRQVSKLELETQAEVDKFAVAALHLWGRELKDHVSNLWQRLFVEVKARPGLSEAEQELYRTSGAAAGAYAKRLLSEYIEPGRLDGFLADLRQTYRLAGAEKLRAFSAA
jgi:hypothetical protein